MQKEILLKNFSMKTKTKYMYKVGDWRDLYTVGEEVMFKWHFVWMIEKVTYDKDKNQTTIKLIKTNKFSVR